MPASLVGFCRFFLELPRRYGRQVTAGHYVPQIDGLRALSVLLVVLWHGGLRGVRRLDALDKAGAGFASPYAWLPHGEIGVAVFFVISGFVIALPFLKRPRSEWRLGNFYMRRVRRIYPPYLLALVGCLMAAVLGIWRVHLPPGVSLSESFVAGCLYLNGVLFDSPSPFNPPMWSLEAEIQFYIIAPFLLLLYRHSPLLSRRLATGVTFGLVMIALVALFHALTPFDGRFRFALPAHFHLFLLGIMMADLAVSVKSYGTYSSSGSDVLFFGGLAALYGTGVWLTSVNAEPQGWLPWAATAVLVSGTAVAIFWGAVHGRIAGYVLSRPWVRFTGAMTYSIYLVHVPVLEALNKLFLTRFSPSSQAELWVVWSLLAVGVIWVCSLFFYICVEYPFMKGSLSRPVPKPAEGVPGR